MMSSNSKLSFFPMKIVLAGPTSSGKTSIIARQTEDNFKEEMTETVGLDFITKLICVN